jgi:hypothetical protein
LGDSQVADAAVVAGGVVAQVAIETFVFLCDFGSHAGIDERGGGRVKAELESEVVDQGANAAAVPGVVDELIEDLELVSAGGAEVFGEAVAEVGEDLLLAGEDDDVGGGETVGGSVACGPGLSFRGAGSAGVLRRWPGWPRFAQGLP